MAGGNYLRFNPQKRGNEIGTATNVGGAAHADEMVRTGADGLIDPSLLPGGLGGAGPGTANTYRLNYQANGVYVLSPPPIVPNSVLLFINGAKQAHSIDFNVNGAVLNWVSALTLSTTDLIEAIY